MSTPEQWIAELIEVVVAARTARLTQRVSLLAHYVGIAADRLGLDDPSRVHGDLRAVESVGEETLAAIERLRSGLIGDLPGVSAGDPNDGHTFEIAARSRGSYAVVGEPHTDADWWGEPHTDADWWGDPCTLRVRGWSLSEALAKAAARPLPDWHWPLRDEPEPASAGEETAPAATGDVTTVADLVRVLAELPPATAPVYTAGATSGPAAPIRSLATDGGDIVFVQLLLTRGGVSRADLAECPPAGVLLTRLRQLDQSAQVRWGCHMPGAGDGL